jgi:hypothetical protein
VMQLLKQHYVRRLLRSARRRAHPDQGALWASGLQAGEVWQRRFYDFVVWASASASKNFATCIAIR